MGMIRLLKALADISAFYLFTGPIAAYFGGNGLIFCVFLQALAYTLARQLPKKWMLPLPVVLLAVCYFLCRNHVYSLIAITPATVYLLWQYLRQSAFPELTQQQEIMEGLGKLVGFAALVSVLIGEVPALIPFALLIFGSNVALLRTLRHDPEVYLRPGFQLTNLGILAAVPLTSLLLGTGPVANFIGDGMKWLYLKVLLPFFQAVLYYPMHWIDRFFQYLGTIFRQEEKPQETTEPLGKLEGSPEPPSIDAQQISETGQVLQIILIILLSIFAIIGIILLMRRLGRTDDISEEIRDPRQQRSSILKSGKPPVSEDPPTVQTVRKHYRRYLKLCVRSGISVAQSSTSQDICHGAQARKSLQPQANRIRQIYIRARYAGLATKEDAKEMATLCAESKKA